MSPGDRYHIFVLWIIFQLLSALSHTTAMPDPYISDFEYSPEFHPSRNPSCPRRWARGAWEDRRSPEEGDPVGQEPSIEIRAVLVRCPKSPEEMSQIPMSGNVYNITAGRRQDILEFHGFDTDEPPHHSEVRNCRRKLIVTMKLNNVGKTRTQEEFVVVDHVLDPVTMHKARLLNPFVFKVRQEQVLQLYGLKFQSVVNGEAKEEVVNKKSSNYTGCDDSLLDPTCGRMMFDGQPIPYSQGFCCSCDPDVNAARQPVKSSTSLDLASSKIMPFRSGSLGGFRESVSKRERSLKSSELEDDHEETDFRAFRPAFSDQSPTRAKIEPYIDAVGKGNVPKASGLRKEKLTADLVNLENEYDALKKSRSKISRKERKSNPKCKDFRKLARNRSSNLEVTRNVKKRTDNESVDINLHSEDVSLPIVESKDQYADWVIKYAKLNDNHLANSQIEEPYSLETDTEKLDKSDDSLSHIADKVMKEFEAAESDGSVNQEVEHELVPNYPEARDRRNFEDANPTGLKIQKKKSEKKSVEPATIVKGIGDMVKGDFIYRDQTATVIADHEYDSVGNQDESRRKNLREYLNSKRSNNSMGEKVLANYDRLVRDRSMRDKFERLDNLVRDSLRSRRRTFRSVVYDDPFHRGRDEKQEKIDQQIDKEFAEITEALDAASDRRTNVKIPDKIVGESIIAGRESRNRITRGRKGKGKGKGGRHRQHHTVNKGTKVEIRKKLVETPMTEALDEENMLKKIPDKRVRESIIARRKSRNRIMGRRKGIGGRHKLLPAINKGIKVQIQKNAIRSSTSEYDGAKPNINEIVKEIIKSDYRGGKRRYSSPRRQARMGNGKKSSVSSLRDGNMLKKCQDSPVTPFFSDEEKYGVPLNGISTHQQEQNVTTDRSTIVTQTQTVTEPAALTQETPIISNHELQTLTSEISNSSVPPSTTVTNMNEQGSTEPVQIEIISDGLTESTKLDEPGTEADTLTDHPMFERSLVDPEGGDSAGVEATSFMSYGDVEQEENSSTQTTVRDKDDVVIPTNIYYEVNTSEKSDNIGNELVPTTYVYGQSFEEENVTGSSRETTEEPNEVMTTVIFEKPMTTFASERPKSIGQLLKLNETGGSSVILVKTYSVSENPEEFLDNYKFPVNVKKILLKKLNDTSELRREEEQSLAQKVNRLIANQERANDTEDIEAPKVEKVIPEKLRSPHVQNQGIKRMGKKSVVMIEGTSPPDDYTTHFSWEDDVNATNYGFAMEEKYQKNDNRRPDVESFYDYDPDSDHPLVKRSCLKKREIKDVRRCNDVVDDAEPQCRDGADLKWQGKMDLLKLKKHQDILKEYLNWSPEVDTTVMRIYAISSTIGAAPTTKKSNKQEEASTMSILLVEDDKPKQNDDASAEGQLDDKQILEKLRKIPGDDNLMIISVTERNKSNLTGADVKIFEPKRRSAIKKRNGRLRAKSAKRQKRNVNSSNIRKGRNSRRLMSAQLRDEDRPEISGDDEEVPRFDYSSSLNKKKKRKEPKQLDKPPTDKGKTAMEKLHVFDADKYVKMLANKISRISSIDAEQDLGTEKRAKVVNDSRKARAESSLDKKDVAALVDDEESMVDYGSSVDGMQSQDPIFGKLGSDFEISISGKVHINGDQTDGQPMSISIEGLSVDNVTSSHDSSHSNGPFPPFPSRSECGLKGKHRNGAEVTRKQDERVFYDGADLNKKQTLFGEAGPSEIMNPRKTFYNVVVRANPRNVNWPVGASGSEDPAETVQSKSPERLTDEEPVFDFAKLELRDGKPSARQSSRAAPYRKERGAHGETQKRIEHRIPEDVKLVKLVPVELVQTKNPNRLVASKNLESIEAKSESLEARSTSRRGAFGLLKSANSAPSNHISKLSEPCFAAEETTMVSNWRNFGPQEGRLSTDDIPSPRDGDAMIKGVKISSPGEPQDYDTEVSDCGEKDTQDVQKPVELKNLMTMMNVFENVKEKKQDQNPKTLMQVQNVLLFPESDDETQGAERVVKIGEGVKHDDKNDNFIIVFGDKDQSPGSSRSGIILNNDKDKSLVSEAESRLDDSKNHRSTENLDGINKSGTENRLHDVKGNIKQVERKAHFPGKRSRSKISEELIKKIESPERKERHDRQARRPVMYAMGDGVLKGTGNKLPSVLNGGELNHKEKRKTKDEDSGVNKRHRRKRKHKKKKKKKKRKKHKKHKKMDGEKKKKKSKWWPFKRNLLAVPEDEVQNRRTKMRKKRQIKAGGTQTRGGQDCMDRRHPAHVDAARYQESAHCLRFSDLWYSVYELENPIVEHTVYLQLFEKHTSPDGTTHWDDLTHGSMVRLGSFVRHQRDVSPTISFTYSGPKTAPQKKAKNLDPVRDRLLVPSPVAQQKLAKYPEVKGGSGEYLVVQSNAINNDGNECDKAGVGFATFATQPDRCGHPKGTCLKNQPLAYWRHDVEARESGRPGCYFLSNFATVPNNPIKYNVSGSGSREYLGLEYHSPHVSAIDIEVKADYNAIVRVGSSGRVTEVYVDSTATEHTVVTIVISNMGLASSPYQSRITDCPTGLPVSWSKAKGALQVIAPQHDQRVTLDLYGQLYVDDFHCSVEVLNHRGELVAMRRIRVQKMDRCFCVWHCLCACVGSVTGLRCHPMSPEHYHAAGFQGPVPVVSVEQSVIANAIKDVMLFSAVIVLLLLILGMLKWLIGVFYPATSRWGLDVLLEGKEIHGYFEPELCCRSIVTDESGRIVHPDTGEKTVRICSRRSEFFLNLIFFLTYPIAVCLDCVKNSLSRRRNCFEDESQVCLLKDESTATSCTKLICVNTYGESKNSKMEAEDTRYVLNELKRSRDSLQNGIGKMSKAGGIRLRK